MMGVSQDQSLRSQVLGGKPTSPFWVMSVLVTLRLGSVRARARVCVCVWGGVKLNLHVSIQTDFFICCQSQIAFGEVHSFLIIVYLFLFGCGQSSLYKGFL